MRLSSNNKHQDDDFFNDKLIKGEPLAVTFDEVVEGDEPSIKGFLLVDAFGTAANTRVTIKQAPGVKGFKSSLRNHILGSDYISKLRKGDIIGFDSAYAENGVALVGSVSARTHDLLMGNVQVLTAMARPSRSIVNKRGASQFLDIADGQSAVVVNTYEAIETAFHDVKGRSWPGGSPGFFMRDRTGYVGEFFESKDHGIDYLISELKFNEIIRDENYVLELVPAWRLPMGRDQVVKDVDPRVELPKPVSGEFTRKFHNSKGNAGFRACLAVIADEYEWAFGAKTGKTIQVVSSVLPILTKEPVLIDKLPSLKQPFGGNPNTIRTLYSDAIVREMAMEREKNAPKSEGKEIKSPDSESRPKERLRGFGSPSGMGLGKR